MKFALIDRILELDPGKRVVAVKAVSLAEEYLADHFPTFPVLPGVFMLEALVESASWLVRQHEDFAHSLILLREANNVTYKSFVKPGQILRVEVDCRRLALGDSQFSGVGRCDDREVVKARFVLRHLNLIDGDPRMASADERLVSAARKRWALIAGKTVCTPERGVDTSLPVD
ncbi:MAG: beta-hydroxyacyl-ACP dehydratase [bacterium]|nr:beta-hydroxyacyl-ACP dehydratase [bacterium]